MVAAEITNEKCYFNLLNDFVKYCGGLTPFRS